MEFKNPKRKALIASLTELHLGAVRKGLDKKRFTDELGWLKFNTAPGLGGLRNGHLIALKLNAKRFMTPSASAVMGN